jgi:hypothetical protein
LNDPFKGSIERAQQPMIGCPYRLAAVSSLDPDRPEIVCICGSTRFADEMLAANRDLTFAGAIVVAPDVFTPSEPGEKITDEQKATLDALHLRKIDLADRVLVINPGGYIGESTSREIAYARATGKPVSFSDPSDHILAVRQPGHTHS